MAGQILERVAKQPNGGTGTMPIIYPGGVHSVYLQLPPGVFDVIVSWNGRAQVEAFHLWNTRIAEKVKIMELPSETTRRERRGFARVSSEIEQWVYFSSSGPFEEGARLSAQAIPANLTIDMEVSTTS